MIIGAGEVPSHHFVNGDDKATTYPIIFSPPTIIIEREQYGVRGDLMQRLISEGGRGEEIAAFMRRN